jgi:hypothetical protein
MKPTFANIESFYSSPVKTENLDKYFSKISQTFNSLPSFHSKDYFSPFNLVFIHRLSRSEVFKKKQVFLVRDGLFDLVAFLMQHPRPPNGFQSLVLFPDSFSPFLPDSWKEVSLGYHYSIKNAFNPGNNKTLMGVGCLCLDSLDSTQVDLFLELQKKKDIKTFFLVDDNVPDYTKRIVGFHSANLMLKQSFFKKLPSDVTFLESRHLVGLNSDSTWSFINIDRDYLIFDRWSDHYMSGLGMKSYVRNKLKITPTLNLAINSFEDILISNWGGDKNYFDDLYMDYKILNIKPDGFYRAFRDSLKNLMP